MADLKELKKLIREIVGANSNLPITATVVSVQGESCTVELSSGLVLTDVKLKATISEGNNYMKLVPKKGSTVLLLSLSGDLSNLTVIKVDEIEKLEFKQDGLEILIDSTDGKLEIKNEQVSFKEILADLTSLLNQFKVNTPAGPSTNIMPDTVVLIDAFETKFKQLLK